MSTFVAVILGIVVWFILRCVIYGFYTVDQNERAVVTTFGKAPRFLNKTTLDDPSAAALREDERERYKYPQLIVMQPGLHFKFPWQEVYKISIATQTVSIAFDPENPQVNKGGTQLEAVTKDQLNTGLKGQIRFGASEKNLYACLFGVKNPISHVMGYFVSVLRERISNFEAPENKLSTVDPLSSSHIPGISINDLRKNLSELNHQMEKECSSSVARYGILLDAALITEIDPPHEVESALAAINTAHNQVSSEISIAQAAADQKIVQSKRAVEIETLKAEAEVELLRQLAKQLSDLKKSGANSLGLYLRNVKLKLFNRAKRIVLEAGK
jgi:regulator of protease activity HflC (stomatin/prohibitin superfamily)